MKTLQENFTGINSFATILVIVQKKKNVKNLEKIIIFNILIRKMIDL